MKRAQVEVHIAQGMKPVAAYLSDHTPGLAIHRAIGGQGFSVTHVGSGRRAHDLPFPTQACAVEYADLIGALFDFTLSRRELEAEMRDDGSNRELVLQLEARVREKHMDRKPQPRSKPTAAEQAS